MNLTITLGDALSIAAVLFGGVGIYVRLAERLTKLEVKVDAMWTRRLHARD
jgi:hypothetical protein